MTTTPLEAARAELERQAEQNIDLSVYDWPVNGQVYVDGPFDLAALVDAVLAAQRRPDSNARPLVAAREVIARTKAGTRTIASHVTHGINYWNAGLGGDPSLLAELALAEAALECLKEFLIRQPLDRTVLDVLNDLYPESVRPPA